MLSAVHQITEYFVNFYFKESTLSIIKDIKQQTLQQAL
jgi:hypothetical protein